MRYPAVVHEEEGAFVVDFPACPGCVTQAESKEEIIPMAREALSGWLAGTMNMGVVPPIAPRHVGTPKGHRLLWIDVPPKLAVKIALRQTRDQAGLSQEQLAKRARVSRQQITKLEDPDSNPTIDTLEKVAQALGVTLEIGLVPMRA